MIRPGQRSIVALLAGLVAVAGSFAVSGLRPSFVVAPVDAVVVRATPAELVAFAIEELGYLGELLAYLTAVALTVALFAIASYVGLLVADAIAARVSIPSRVSVAVLVGGTTLVLAWLLSGSALSSVGAAAPAVVLAAAAAPADPGSPDGTVDSVRRRVLAASAGAVAFGVLSYALGSRRATDIDHELPEAARAADAATLQEQADGRSLEIDGIPGLVSGIDDFYEVDINNVDPVLEASEWTLSVTGAVESSFTVTYDELVDGDVRTGYNTLRCVGEQLNGDLLDNAIWTAVPVAPLLERADPGGGCECVMVRAADDYYEQFPIAALERSFLAFGMNGESLPREHGHPVRLLVPGHWGEINVKWVTEIEVLDREVEGYWEERGWHGTGPVNTVAKLWTVNERADGRVQVGGHAYAGSRGIETVEVSVDGGDSWETAELSEPLPSEHVLGERDAWRQWQYTWEPPAGDHEVVVRAIDGTGTVQPAEEESPYPSGSSGWVSETITV